jgi:hypothetical protein
MDLSADFLFTCQYQFIKRFFYSTDIRMSYGTMEFGQIAQQVPGKSLFTYEVYPDVAFVENDKDSNLIVSAYNHKTIPMLRYRTDDKGTVVNSSGKQYIVNLVGKQADGMDYIALDDQINVANAQGLHVINARIDDKSNTLRLTCTHPVGSDVLQNTFKGWNLIIDTCKQGNCPCIDTYVRKVTPVLKEHDIMQ